MNLLFAKQQYKLGFLYIAKLKSNVPKFLNIICGKKKIIALSIIIVGQVNWDNQGMKFKI